MASDSKYEAHAKAALGDDVDFDSFPPDVRETLIALFRDAEAEAEGSVVAIGRGEQSDPQTD